jgi:hypothetical protein
MKMYKQYINSTLDGDNDVISKSDGKRRDYLIISKQNKKLIFVCLLNPFV